MSPRYNSRGNCSRFPLGIRIIYHCTGIHVCTYTYKIQKKTILHAHTRCLEVLFSFNILRPVIDYWVDRNRNVLGANKSGAVQYLCSTTYTCENKSRRYDTVQIILNLLSRNNGYLPMYRDA